VSDMVRSACEFRFAVHSHDFLLLLISFQQIDRYVLRCGAYWWYHHWLMALKSVAFHMASDVIALIIGVVAASMAGKPALSQSSSTYGYLRGEGVAELCNGVFLLAVCFIILLEALERFSDINSVKTSISGRENIVLIIGAIGLAFNIIGLFVFHSHSHNHGEHEGHVHGNAKVSDDAIVVVSDMNEQVQSDIHQHTHEHSHEHEHQHDSEAHSVHHDHEATAVMHDKNSTTAHDKSASVRHRKHKKQHSDDGHSHGHEHSDQGTATTEGHNANSHGVILHVLGDALESVAVIVSTLIIKYATAIGDARFYFDLIASVLITCFISYHTVPFVRSCICVMLQRAPVWLDVSALRAEVKYNFFAIITTHHIALMH
jgi:solute carrier family 30 (zinc transporter), member 1